MEKSNSLTVDPDFQIRFDRQTYNYTDLGQAVGYWLHILDQFDPADNIGLIQGGLSFSAVAFMLALYQSGRNFCSNARNAPDRSEFQQLVIVGESFNMPNIDTDYPNARHIHRTDSWNHSRAIVRWTQPADLTITFRQSQQRQSFTSGSTGTPKKVFSNSYVDSLSIITSRDRYFKHTDYCVFSHGMGHDGVHTTAILPAVFGAGMLSLCDSITWDEEIVHATHIQYFYSMMQFFKLPQQLRILTTGGGKTKIDFVKLILDNCNITEGIRDIYGLTECLPTLAENTIHTLDDLDRPMLWVNDYHIPQVDADNNLFVQRNDGHVVATGDIAELTHVNGKTFMRYIDRYRQSIRFNGLIIPVEQFKQEFESHTQVYNYVVQFEQNNPVIYVESTDVGTVNKFIFDYQLDIGVKSKQTLNTAGGIKHISS